jgi:HlyD family secretion protein
MKGIFKKKWFWIAAPSALVLILLVGVAVGKGKKATSKSAVKTVRVEKKTIVDKALAIGSLEPKNEIAVKSKISGVVGRLFVEVGDYVSKGQPLLEVKPDPTPLELAEAKRAVEMASI